MGSKPNKQNKTPVMSIILLGKHSNSDQVYVAKTYYKIMTGLESDIFMDFCIVTNSINIDNEAKICKTKIWNMNFGYNSLWTSAIKSTLGAGIVFDITNKETFNNLDEYIQKINEEKEGTNFPFILIGNKCECQSDRKVSKEEAEQYAEINRMKYFEVSSTTGEGVKDCIDYLIEKSFRKYLELNKNKKKIKK